MYTTGDVESIVNISSMLSRIQAKKIAALREQIADLELQLATTKRHQDILMRGFCNLVEENVFLRKMCAKG